AMAKGRRRPKAAEAFRGRSLFSLPAGRGRLGDGDRIGGGESVLQTLFEQTAEPAFSGPPPLALGLFGALPLPDGLLRSCHGCSPCERPTGRAIVQITHEAWRAFPYQGSVTSDQSSEAVFLITDHC